MENNSKKTKQFSSEKQSFMSNPQFLALKYRFDNVLESIKDDVNLREISAEFSLLLRTFQDCFSESQRKTLKILELTSIIACSDQKTKALSSDQDITIEDSKKKVRELQCYLDKANKERIELLKQIEDLKIAVDTENKMIQVHENSFKNIQENVETYFKFMTKKDSDSNKESEMAFHATEKICLDEKSKEEDDSDKFNIAKLKNNLKILVLDLKLSRQKVSELKKEIRKKDVLMSEIQKNFCESEKLLTETEIKFSNIHKQMEMKMAKYKTELNTKTQTFQSVSEELEKTQLLNNELFVDISSKVSVIDSLKIKTEELNLAKMSAIRNAEVFERHLVRSNNCNNDLKIEIKILKDEVESLKKQVSKKLITEKLRSEKERKEEIDSQENTIDNLKNHIVLRDQKLRQTEDKLNAASDVIRKLKEDFSAITNQKSNLQSKIVQLKEKLSVKIKDVKYLKEKLFEERKESARIKKELRTLAGMHKQVANEKNELNNLFNQMKFLYGEQKKENDILKKRELYLVKVLKEQNIEDEKIITRRRQKCEQSYVKLPSIS